MIKTRVEQLATAELEARLYSALRRSEDFNLPEAARLAKLRFAETAWGELLRRQRRERRGGAAQGAALNADH